VGEPLIASYRLGCSNERDGDGIRDTNGDRDADGDGVPNLHVNGPLPAFLALVLRNGSDDKDNPQWQMADRFGHAQAKSVAAGSQTGGLSLKCRLVPLYWPQSERVLEFNAAPLAL